MIVLVARYPSNVANVRSTTITRVSTASSPAPLHNAQSASNLPTDGLGGEAGQRPRREFPAKLGRMGNHRRANPKRTLQPARLAEPPEPFRLRSCRVGDEEYDERHDGGIEPLPFKRQCHCVTLNKHRAGQTRPHSGNRQLRVARIDALHLNWRASLGNQVCEGARSTSNIEPPQAFRGRKPIEEFLPRKSTPRAHAKLIRVCVFKTYGLFARRPRIH